MPDKYIVNMTEKTTPEDTNLLVIEDAVDTKKITFTNLFKPIKDLIGNLASLTTSHKSTLVGATNELKTKIDAIEADNSLLRYRGHLTDINLAPTMLTGYYNLNEETLNNDRFYAYTAVTVVHRFGTNGYTLVTGLSTDLQSVVGKAFVT